MSPNLRRPCKTKAQRLGIGDWVGVDPASMNALGEASGLGASRYVDVSETGFKLPETFNRAFSPDSAVPGL